MVPTNLVKRCNTIQEVIALFPQKAETIKAMTDAYLVDAKKQIDAIVAVHAGARTYANTFHALDVLSSLSDVEIAAAIFQAVSMTSPEESVRNAAQEAMVKISEFFVEHVANNKPLFDVLNDYAQNGASHEALTDEQKYYIEKTIQGFTRSGINLPEEQRTNIAALRNEITELGLTFDKNVAQESRTITVKPEDLRGVNPTILQALKKTEQGEYILGTDYPTAFAVFDDCEVEATRKRMKTLFDERAYPVNDAVLTQLIEKRDQLARALGYESYAHYELEEEMVKTPEHAYQFLQDLVQKADVKAEREIKDMIANLPEGVTLSPDGRIKSWDMSYVQKQYVKKLYSVDEQLIAQYFPMKKTIEGLLAIYRAFFDIDFEQVPVSGAWHPDVQAIAVYTAGKQKLLGYLILDMFPRPNKYGHAAHSTVVPAVTLPDGSSTTRVSVVYANFPKETAESPSLLKRSDVSTFFHEFGHALHAFLGETTVGSFSGTSVKRDFVELPSQMLEQWLLDKDIVRNLSSHYQTGAHLPDDMIEKIIRSKHVATGLFIKRQVFLATAALELYKSGAGKVPLTVWNDLYVKMVPYIFNDGELVHGYASFGHLVGYGARYYGYSWSQVFALDVFDTIKQEGLLNPVVGKRYVATIIGKGGSKDPNELLYDFLGRKPNNTAFLRDLGI